MFGLISTTDKFHKISKKIFGPIISGELKNIFIPTSAFLEYELVLKSQEIDENEIIKDIVHFQNIENIQELPLDSSIIVTAIKLN